MITNLYLLRIITSEKYGWARYIIFCGGGDGSEENINRHWEYIKGFDKN